ncbi:MAG: hypothetical protein RIS90_267, partial [Pseudomonadota bacterium]
MSSTTVAEFATELKKSTETLLEQLKSAGVAKSAASDNLTEADKQRLLGYLQASHGTASAERKKITLVKKSTSEIKQADSTGKARTIQVEVRKKRTFVRRDDGADSVPESAAMQPEQEAPAQPLIDTAELARREEDARRQAELIRRQEEELLERRREREAQEARAREAAQEAAQRKAAEQAAADAAAEKARPVMPAATAQDVINSAAARAAEASARAQTAALRWA